MSNKKKDINKAEDAERLALVAKIEGDLPYDEETYIKETSFYLRRSVEDIIEAGKRLLVLHEKARRRFYEICGKIGIPTTTAYRFMNCALKVGKFPKIESEVSQLGQKCKVYALLEAPEEELKKFEQLGLFAGKNIDEIERMSVKELRETAKRLRDNTDEIVKEKTDELRRLNKQLQKERDELHDMVPTAPDGSWAEKPLMLIQEAFIRLDNLLSSFAFDPSIIGNDKLQAKVEGFRVEMEKRSVLFIERWEEHTGKKVGK